MEIEYIDIGELQPYEFNARHHGKDDVEKIAASIKEFGMNDPIGIWNGIIVEGHGRLLACKELGIKTVPVIRLDHLTDEQRRAYTLAHNKTAENSRWDFDILDQELDKIVDIDMSNFGFDVESFGKDDEPGEAEPKKNERERTFDAYRLRDIDLSRCTEKWQMPRLKATQYVPEDLISFNYMLTSDEYEKGIHFFIDDYQFERMWNDPHKYTDRLKQFDCCLTPDFSLYQEMPLPEQIYNVFRSKLIGQIMQDTGITVIPTLQWCRPDSYEFAFDGLEPGGVYAISTIGVKQQAEARKLFDDGMDEAIRVLNPTHIICYGGDIGYKFPCEVSYIGNHNAERFGK